MFAAKINGVLNAIELSFRRLNGLHPMASCSTENIASVAFIVFGMVAFSSGAAAQNVTSPDGRTYQIVEIERILDSGFPYALFSYGKPTVFSGVRIVTTGWLDSSCNITKGDSNLLSPITYHFGEGSLPLYWGAAPVAEYKRAEEACRAYADSRHIDWKNANGALFLLYGTIRNGGRSPYSVCFTSQNFPHKDTVGCDHLDVEHVEFQNGFESHGQFFGDVGGDIARYLGPELIKHLISKGL
jgi:hypothetical protein